jgi:hypothetical protein
MSENTKLQDKFLITTAYQERVQKLFKKPQKGKDKAVLDRLHDEWFFNLPPGYFKKLTEEWNERNLRIKIKPQKNYDEWLNYFKTLPPTSIKMLAATGQDFLPTEAYAALSRWHDIIGNPHRIDKIHQSGLTSPKANKDSKTIAQLALANDRLGVLKATRDKIAEKLDKGAGSRDTALLTREMTEIMTQIADYEKRLGPKKTTELGRLLDEVPNKKRTRSKGARNTSFKSRVTIEDVN